MQRVKLLVDPPKSGDRREILIECFPLQLGRSLQNDVPLAFPSVSGRHLLVDRGDDGIITITDLDSTNGTHVGNQPLPPRQARTIELPTRLRLGEIRIELDYADQIEPQFTMAQSSTELRRMVDDVVSQAPAPEDTRPFFEILSGPGCGLRHFVETDGRDSIIGTDTDADIPLQLTGLPDRLATLCWDGPRIWLDPHDPHIEFEHSPLTKRHLLHSGDRFIICSLELLYFDPLEDALVSMDPGDDQPSPSSSAPPVENENSSGQPDIVPPEESTLAEATAVPDGPRENDDGPRSLGAVEIVLLSMSIFFLTATLVLLAVFFIT